MQKVINGRRYNTETAIRLGGFDNGLYGNNFDAYGESLYRTRSGAYFVFKYGGLHNFPDGNDVIEPVTIAEAQEWAEKHLDGEDYCQIFGEVEEAGGDNVETERIMVTLSNASVAYLRERKQRTGNTISNVVEYAVRKLMESERGNSDAT